MGNGDSSGGPAVQRGEGGDCSQGQKGRMREIVEETVHQQFTAIPVAVSLLLLMITAATGIVYYDLHRHQKPGLDHVAFKKAMVRVAVVSGLAAFLICLCGTISK